MDPLHARPKPKNLRKSKKSKQSNPGGLSRPAQNQKKLRKSKKSKKSNPQGLSRPTQTPKKPKKSKKSKKSNPQGLSRTAPNQNNLRKSKKSNPQGLSRSDQSFSTPQDGRRIGKRARATTIPWVRSQRKLPMGTISLCVQCWSPGPTVHVAIALWVLKPFTQCSQQSLDNASSCPP